MITCPHCLNEVRGYRMGQMTVKVAHHFLNDGSRCPGSDSIRSTAR